MEYEGILIAWNSKREQMKIKRWKRIRGNSRIVAFPAF